MKDGVSKGLGNSRYLKSSIAVGTTHQELVDSLRAGTFPFDFNGINAAGWDQQGTILNKAHMLPDAIATRLKLNPANDPDIKDALDNIHAIGDIILTTDVNQPANRVLANGAKIDQAAYPTLAAQRPFVPAPWNTVYVDANTPVRLNDIVYDGTRYVAVGIHNNGQVYIAYATYLSGPWTLYVPTALSSLNGSSPFILYQGGRYIVAYHKNSTSPTPIVLAYTNDITSAAGWTVRYPTGSSTSDSGILGVGYLNGNYYISGNFASGKGIVYTSDVTTATLWTGKYMANGVGNINGYSLLDGNIILAGYRYESSSYHMCYWYCNSVSGTFTLVDVFDDVSNARAGYPISKANNKYIVCFDQYYLFYADSIAGPWTQVYNGSSRLYFAEMFYGGGFYWGHSYVNTRAVRYSDALDLTWTDFVVTTDAYAALVTWKIVNGHYIIVGYGVGSSADVRPMLWWLDAPFEKYLPTVSMTGLYAYIKVE